MANGILLPSQSRYANLGFITEFSSLERTLDQADYTEPTGLTYKYHTVRENEEITQIAYRYFSQDVENASQYYWVICLSNSIFTPHDLSEYIGKTIRIPNILQFLNRI
jgi:hypothetical protein